MMLKSFLMRASCLPCQEFKNYLELLYNKNLTVSQKVKERVSR